MSAKRTKRKLQENDPVSGTDTLPVSVGNDWTVHHVGPRSKNHWKLTLRDPITCTGAAATHIYKLPFRFTLYDIFVNQWTAAGVVSAAALDIDIGMMLPDGRSVAYFYSKDGVMWATGNLILSKFRGEPLSFTTLVIVENGTNTNELEVTISMEVHGWA